MNQNIEEILDPQLEVHLQRLLTGYVNSFRLELRDHGLVLRGYSRTYYAKLVAQEMVMATIALPIRANEIDVSANKRGTQDDFPTG